LTAEKLDKKRQILPTLSCFLLIHPTKHDIQKHNDPQMSLDYHLVDPLGDDDEKDEQQSDVLMMAVDQENFG
jgi:hypothetical protein